MVLLYLAKLSSTAGAHSITYDFNVFTAKKANEKLNYMHMNPVERGLVFRPKDWKWSSARFYLLGEEGP